MPMHVVTHNGTFHADDVLAFAMIRAFYDPEATIERTRDAARIGAADVVIDVGGVFDPAAGRFDHHQAEYTGNRSSAGMVLDWLEAEGRVAPELANVLRIQLVDYVDAVDNGVTTPPRGVPCFTSIVGTFNNRAGEAVGFDARYRDAVDFAVEYVTGIGEGHAKIVAARDVVRAAMAAADASGTNVMFLDGYYSWKQPYFENGGRAHRTEFVVFPADDAWRVIAIPPEPGSFATKRPLPEAWAGLIDADLERETGVAGARFCHKNRFIAVFATKEGLLEALETHGLVQS